MSSQVDLSTSPLDTVKLGLAIALVLGASIAFYVLDDYSTLLRVIALLVAAGIGIGIAYTTQLGRSFWSFVLASRGEVRKVVWPTRQETLQTTLIVILMVILVGIFLWIVDSILGWAIRLIS